MPPRALPSRGRCRVQHHTCTGSPGTRVLSVLGAPPNPRELPMPRHYASTQAAWASELLAATLAAQRASSLAVPEEPAPLCQWSSLYSPHGLARPPARASAARRQTAQLPPSRPISSLSDPSRSTSPHEPRHLACPRRPLSHRSGQRRSCRARDRFQSTVTSCDECGGPAQASGHAAARSLLKGSSVSLSARDLSRRSGQRRPCPAGMRPNSKVP
jgi:hypothetical protein